jgi:ATP-binding cassette subfamily F protein uup
VSHDRSFLDNLCTSTLVFEGGGRVKEYVGGYSDWKRTVERRRKKEASERKRTGSGDGSGKGRGNGEASATSGARDARPAGPRKLTWKEKQEMEALPGRIERLEEDLSDLHDTMGDPSFYQGDPDEIRRVTREAGALEEEIEDLFARWSELSERPS